MDDLDAVVDEPTSKGVAFEHYDQPPVVTDERGVATFPDGKVAYFKDPDGNVLSIGSQTQGWKLGPRSISPMAAALRAASR